MELLHIVFGSGFFFSVLGLWASSLLSCVFKYLTWMPSGTPSIAWICHHLFILKFISSLIHERERKVGGLITLDGIFLCHDPVVTSQLARSTGAGVCPACLGKPWIRIQALRLAPILCSSAYCLHQGRTYPCLFISILFGLLSWCSLWGIIYSEDYYTYLLFTIHICVTWTRIVFVLHNIYATVST